MIQKYDKDIICFALYDYYDDEKCYGCYTALELKNIFGCSLNSVYSKLTHSIKYGKPMRFQKHIVKAYRYAFKESELTE